ncbi:MAG: hypothetical protein JO263_01070, partial [Candidatus Eremiobacteraeota bacterium]|nr:hypothetical protein [Candidatus Eremiobacteraeota bacterium]
MVANTLNVVPTWAIMLAVAVLVLVAVEAGFQLTRIPSVVRGSDAPSVVVQSAAFTLVGLLLAFSFSLALGRYDARRGVLVREANAIGTTLLRTDILDAATASALRADLRQYVAERIDFVLAETDAREQTLATEKSARLQQDMWQMAMRAARRDPRSTTIPLFVATLNDTIDLSTEEAAVQEAHIPDIVIVGLVLIILIASSIMGFAFGRQSQQAILSTLLFAVTLAIAIGLVLDLDRPERGLIRVN